MSEVEQHEAPKEPIAPHGDQRRERPQPIIPPLLVLLLLTLVSQLAGVMYNSWVAAQAADAPERSILTTLMVSTIALCVITIPSAGFGLLLGRQVGLGTPLLTDLIRRRPGAVTRLRNEAMLAMPLGFATGVLLILIRMATVDYLPPELPPFGHRGATAGLLLSAGAAVAEEIWARLGAMTLFAYVGARLLGHSTLQPSVAWAANLLAALAFGMIHLPQLAQFGAATPIGIAATLLGNGIVGILYGWLYWRRSLVAAMLAHFAVDLVLHVLTALAS